MKLTSNTLYDVSDFLEDMSNGVWWYLEKNGEVQARYHRKLHVFHVLMLPNILVPNSELGKKRIIEYIKNHAPELFI